MPQNPYKPIFEVTRGHLVESLHYGAVAISDSTGALAAWYGDPDVSTYLRSSAKPFQALPFLENGGQAAFQLSLREIALMCASHSGTDNHVETVRSIQEKTGVQETELMCGVHQPYHAATAEAMLQRGEQPSPNRHNCSGKHTGMLAFVKMRNQSSAYREEEEAPVAYIDPEHPIQRDILTAFAEMCGLPREKVSIGIDGCSAPNFAVPLRSAAFAFARLCDPGQLPLDRANACRTITRAMMEHPDMVGGPDSFDTHLMELLKGRIICKGGAEGYQALGLMPGALGPGFPALGIAFKISDGDLAGHSRAHSSPYGRVRPAVALEILRQLGAIREEELETLSDYGPQFPIQNWRKLLVGEGRPRFTLERSAEFTSNE
jgi:L-asparaginase II